MTGVVSNYRRFEEFPAPLNKLMLEVG